VTILITSHEITIVHTFAQRVLCLNRSLVCDGPITELFKEEILKKLYQRDIFVYPFNRPLNEHN
jgi:ABC-type Mn2+/Zn2+ transport system ATPase subunit